jgi:CheY-like chemotaxis protein/signal transduction histidine kinase
VVNTTFRLKLFAIFGATLLALVSVLAVSAWMGVRQSRELDDVQGRLVPRTELGPRVEAEFERLARGMQDAVAAQDPAALDATLERKAALFELVNHAGAAIDPATAASVRWAVQDYYQTAREVSQRMIAGESSEALLQEVTRMQAQQAKAAALIKRSTSVDRSELSGAFHSVREANQSADRLRLGITLAGIFGVALLAFWGGRGVLQALGHLSSGLARFGTGDFRTPIPVKTKDELSSVAEQANQMASSLARLSEAREQDDWLKAGLSGLSEQLRGDLEPHAVAERGLAFLAERVGALAGALYLSEGEGRLVLAALYAGGPSIRDGGAAERFNEGEGLVGQAFVSGELALIDDLPSGYMRIKSGLGEAVPEQLLLLPLVHFGRKAAVVELALLKPVSRVARELLLAARAQLVIAIEAARASAARKELLQATQAQAERLTAQEEELRLNNQELLAQQEELRRANHELEQQRVELATQNGELERARSILSQKADELNRVSSYKSQFLANMSHELRTPLNSMLLLSHLLSENEAGNITPKQVEHLRTIHSAGQDLLGLINEVLDLSKIEAGKQDVTLESVELAHFVAFVRRLFEATASQKGLVLATNIDPGAPALLVTDRQRVERILINLLSNALKFTERGQVALWIGRPRGASAGLTPGDAVAFEVTDTGAGIPEAARERVFAPFEQVQGQANRGHAGTGLGLPIARESARLLGGDLLLERSSDDGSTFVCVVPERASPTASSHVAALPAKRVEDDSSELAPNEPHLLIIEDDSVLAEQLVEIVHARRLKVVVVGTGQEGLRLAAQGRTLGIILDVRLPDLDGWSVMERLKQDPRTRSIPVHFVSGVDAPHRGAALGAVGYLVKPASHADLAKMVRTLAPAKPLAQGILIVEDDPHQGNSILALLEQDGVSAKLVRTASAALEALRSDQFGCVILDLGLPDMDGLGVIEALRQQPELGSPRVVIHTGRALSKQETRQLEAYAEAIVLKDGSSAERLLEETRLFVHHLTPRSAPPQEPAAIRHDVSLRGVKLLLAEDDMRTIYSLSALLRSRGADIVTAETGQEALDALATHADIRGVLMDIMMPEMDGYEAMRRLRREPRFSALPVIALTAKAMKGERERCLEAGASDYLPKPIDSDKLLTTLRNWLSLGAD